MSSEQVMRRPNRQEKANPGLRTLGGSVTNWRQCAILGLTPAEIVAVRGATGTRATVQSKLTEVRQKMRRDGWAFPANPKYADRGEGSTERPFLRAVPPASAAACDADRAGREIQEAEASWQDEVARQLRSGWGTRLRPGKAAGN